MTGLNRIWIRDDQKRMIKKKAAAEDKTIPDVIDDLLGGSDDGLRNYEYELKKGFRKLL